MENKILNKLSQIKGFESVPKILEDFINKAVIVKKDVKVEDSKK